MEQFFYFFDTQAPNSAGANAFCNLTYKVHNDDVCCLGKDWNENVIFGGKKLFGKKET